VAGAVSIYGVVPIPSSLLLTTTIPATTMTYNSPNTGPSIFQGGKLKPGIYKIQNLASGTYVDTKDDVRELCGRPTSALENGKGQVRPQHDRPRA